MPFKNNNHTLTMSQALINEFFNFYEHIVKNIKYSNKSYLKITRYQYGNQYIKSLQSDFENKLDLTLKVKNLGFKVIRNFNNMSTRIRCKDFTLMFYHINDREEHQCKMVAFKNSLAVPYDVYEVDKYILPGIHILNTEDHFQVTCDNANVINVFKSKGKAIYQIFDNVYTDNKNYCLLPKLNGIDRYISYEQLPYSTDNQVVIYPGLFKNDIIDTKITIAESDMTIVFDNKKKTFRKVVLKLDDPLFLTTEFDKQDGKFIVKFDLEHEKYPEYTFVQENKSFKNDDPIFLKNQFTCYKSFVRHMSKHISHYEKSFVPAC